VQGPRSKPSDSLADVESLRAALTELKREVAKVIAAMQLGGDRAKRRELSKRLAACRKRAKALEAPAEALLASAGGDGAPEVRAELEQAQRFLTQMRTMGVGPGST
jgi:hypothetical protein